MAAMMEGRVSRILERYEETLMGLPYPVVLLDAAEEIVNPDDGEVLGVAVPDADGLATAVALALCFMPVRLTGAEVRFIRRVLGMTGQELAAAVEMDSATLSRWEHGKQEVGAWADKAVRMATVLRLQDHAPGSSLRPEDVVTLKLSRRVEGHNPEIKVHRPKQEIVESDVKGWDAMAELEQYA
jgi:transcriptional regulator with XRE-family HTH domain